jgi:hypothetical protein
MKQMKLDGDIDGLVDIGPIRKTLEGIFDMLGAFGGEEMAKFSRLPEVLQRVELSFSLDSKKLFQAVVFIDDDELASELASLASGNSQSGVSPLLGGGLPFGLGGSSAGGGRDVDMMISPTSAAVITEVGEEIADKELFSIEGKERSLTMTLERPSQLNELITAALYDAKRQFELAQRIENLGRIATAMEAYVEKHDCFPPSGVVTDSAEGLPSQFNWRVGLLPYLDEQTLYDQFDFSKPWDSAENQTVANQMPKLFADVSIEGGSEQTSNTRWHVVGGNLGLYKGDRTPKMGDITDKKIWTALVIEGDKQSAVNWIKPGAMEADTADVEGFGVELENGILFLNAAFDPRIIRKNQEDLQGVLTPDGEEAFQRNDFLPISPGQ